jgi:hypothetical protein
VRIVGSRARARGEPGSRAAGPMIFFVK